MTEQELSAYIQAIRPADEAAMEAARRRQALFHTVRKVYLFQIPAPAKSMITYFL